MKRILAILKDKLEDAKLDNKVKRINNALEAAKLNAETDLMESEAKLDEAIAKLSEGAEASTVINELKAAFEKKESIAESLKTIEAIKNYLNEEVTVKKGE